MLTITEASNGFIIEISQNKHHLMNASIVNESTKIVCIDMNDLLKEVEKFYTETAKD